MKNGIFLFGVLLFLFACDDDTGEIALTQVKYEVLTSSGNWYGEYIIETGEKVCICGPPLKSNGWTYSFRVKDKPFTLHIDATSECICTGDPGAPDVTTNIYVDNKLVATNTSNWAPGVASADFVIK